MFLVKSNIVFATVLFLFTYKFSPTLNRHNVFLLRILFCECIITYLTTRALFKQNKLYPFNIILLFCIQMQTFAQCKHFYMHKLTLTFVVCINMWLLLRHDGKLFKEGPVLTANWLSLVFFLWFVIFIEASIN